MLICNLEYQGEEARGLASEALNTGFRARARLAKITWHGRCNIIPPFKKEKACP